MASAHSSARTSQSNLYGCPSLPCQQHRDTRQRGQLTAIVDLSGFEPIERAHAPSVYVVAQCADEIQAISLLPTDDNDERNATAEPRFV